MWIREDRQLYAKAVLFFLGGSLVSLFNQEPDGKTQSRNQCITVRPHPECPVESASIRVKLLTLATQQTAGWYTDWTWFNGWLVLTCSYNLSEDVGLQPNCSSNVRDPAGGASGDGDSPSNPTLTLREPDLPDPRRIRVCQITKESVVQWATMGKNAGNWKQTHSQFGFVQGGPSWKLKCLPSPSQNFPIKIHNLGYTGWCTPCLEKPVNIFEPLCSMRAQAGHFRAAIIMGKRRINVATFQGMCFNIWATPKIVSLFIIIIAWFNAWNMQMVQLTHGPWNLLGLTSWRVPRFPCMPKIGSHCSIQQCCRTP